MSDSLDIEDPVVAANFLISKLPDKNYYYTSVTPYPFGHIGPEYVQYLSGTCREVTDFAVYLFRALGIPCAIDFIKSRFLSPSDIYSPSQNKVVLSKNRNQNHRYYQSLQKHNQSYHSDIQPYADLHKSGHLKQFLFG